MMYVLNDDAFIRPVFAFQIDVESREPSFLIVWVAWSIFEILISGLYMLTYLHDGLK